MTAQEWEVIEILALRQIALYNQKLFEAGLVNFEYKLTEKQKETLNTAARNINTSEMTAKDAGVALILSRQQDELRDLQRRVGQLEEQVKR